jgi:cytochrome oxidase Cu insertion factor (SCO1/SenC/PrrC family)
VPILHGISENSGQTRVPVSVDTGDEQEKQEKFAKNVREQVDLLLAKESPKLPHTVVVYLINPFGQQLGSNAHNPNGSTGKQFEILANAALLCAWNGNECL